MGTTERLLAGMAFVALFEHVRRLLLALFRPAESGRRKQPALRVRSRRDLLCGEDHLSARLAGGPVQQSALGCASGAAAVEDGQGFHASGRRVSTTKQLLMEEPSFTPAPRFDLGSTVVVGRSLALLSLLFGSSLQQVQGLRNVALLLRSK